MQNNHAVYGKIKAIRIKLANVSRKKKRSIKIQRQSLESMNTREKKEKTEGKVMMDGLCGLSDQVDYYE